MPGIDEIRKIIELLFNGQVPSWILTITGIILAFWVSLSYLSKIKEILTKEFLPLLYNKENQRRSSRRRWFADHIAHEIRRLNRLEEWSDYRFAELEAEVEAEANWNKSGFLPFQRRTRRYLRRERSLSKALTSSQDRLILVEGEPGAGKSVALRYVTEMMAQQAAKSKTTKSIIPLYINLKELERGKSELIDSKLIRSFVLKTLKRVNDRDIEEFLEEEFDRGLREKTWLFLFDSFDELPEVLSSTEADISIRNYADAISDFLHGMNQCRGIIASREFRGPAHFGWPRFRILSLSDKRRLQLIRKAGLNLKQEEELIGQLGTASHEIQETAKNPMFLGLLCQHIGMGHPFPENAHIVFETYIGTRLIRDRDRLQRRYGLQPDDVRDVAETVAFCMAMDESIGLSPTRDKIKHAILCQGFEVRENQDAFLDALEYIKLGRSESTATPGDSRSFTFSHRRFQEYFATCVLLHNPSLVPPYRLLTDARWRESAAVMCQTQPIDVLLPLLHEAQELLLRANRNIPGLIDNPLKYVESQADNEEINDSREIFPWPAGILHLLGILQQGFSSRLSTLPPKIRQMSGRLILSANETSSLPDRKWGLEVSGIVSYDILLWLIRDAISSKSQWIKETAYRQIAHLRDIPDDISLWIRMSLIDLAASGKLNREKFTTRTYLSRLGKSYVFLSVLQLLLIIPKVDFIIHLTLFLFLTSQQSISIPSIQQIISQHPSNLLIFIFAKISLLVLALLFSFATYKGLLSPLKYESVTLKSLLGSVCVIAGIRCFIGFGIIALTYFELQPAAIFVYLYLVAWAPIALVFAFAGKFTHPLWWIIMPIILPVYLIYICASYIPIIYEFVMENKQDLVRVTISLAIPLCILMLVSISGIYFYTTNTLLAQSIITTMMVVSVFLMIFIGPIWLIHKIYKSRSDIVGSIRDWIRWHSWSRKQRSPMTEIDFLNMLEQYQDPEYFHQIFKIVREKNLLIPTDSTAKTLHEIATLIENIAHQKKEYTRNQEYFFLKDGNDILSQLPALERLHDHRRHDQWTAEFLDEVCKLLEQVRALTRESMYRLT